MLLVDICNALAIGHIQPWNPASESKHAVASEQPADTDKGGPKRGSKAAPAAAAAAKGKRVQGITIPAEAMPDLKKAVEVGGSVEIPKRNHCPCGEVSLLHYSSIAKMHLVFNHSFFWGISVFIYFIYHST